MPIIQLISSQADEIVDLLGELYVDEVNRRRGSDTVQVTADERLNAVLINAPPADVRALKGLIARLDGTKPVSVVEIKYIPLSSANALETISPDDAGLAGVIRVVDVAQVAPGRSLRLAMDGDRQEALAYLTG